MKEICIECRFQTTQYLCNICQVLLCHACFKKIHSFKSLKSHELLDIVKNKSTDRNEDTSTKIEISDFSHKHLGVIYKDIGKYFRKQPIVFDLIEGCKPIDLSYVDSNGFFDEDIGKWHRNRQIELERLMIALMSALCPMSGVWCRSYKRQFF